MKKSYIIPFIVLTGGPGGGKTTVLNQFEEKLENLGYTVLIIPETATIIILMEQKKKLTLTNLERQRLIAYYQIAEEQKYLKIAEVLVEQGKKPVIICDRGLIDNKAYCTNEEWEILKKEFPTLHDEHVYTRYHGGIFMVTAPKRDYTTKNNDARGENTHKKARKVNDATLLVYEQMLHLEKIGNAGGRDKKFLKAETAIINHIKRLHNN